MIMEQWAQAWGVPPAAVADLRARLGADAAPPATSGQRNEATVSAGVRLDAARAGWLLWRNNVGAYRAESGQLVRYGLCNDSAALNRRYKSSDLIGLRPMTVRPEHVGQTLGLFVAREVKRAGWQYTGRDREAAQLNYLNLVAAHGGDAAFTTGGET